MRFQNYFQQRKDEPEGSKLLNRLKVLKSFPRQRLSGDEDQYEHVAEYRGGEHVGVRVFIILFQLVRISSFEILFCETKCQLFRAK